MKRSTFVWTALAAALLPLAAAAQSDWPNKPVQLIVPYPPGGVNDAVARAYADKLSAEFGKPFLTDNRVGAATTVASNYAAKAAPDGYTIYAGGTSLVINPTLTGNVQYDPHKSFALVSLMSFTPVILHVNAEFPAKDMAGLIALVKANPGKFNIASSGIGATNHLAAELLKAQAGLKLVHVPYKGGAQAGQDVAAGNAQMMFSASLEAKPFLQSGKTRAIAISSLTRSPAFPEIPTVAEAAGLKDFEAVFWQAMVVPAGTPQPIIDRLNAAIVKIAADPEMKARFAAQGRRAAQFHARRAGDLPRQGRGALDDADQGAGHQGGIAVPVTSRR
jgi:tripartite-type tricarboxylate transporter receptor subunit TctC